MSAKLIKIDRNGTKYYEGMVTCPRCGGQGGSDQWQYTGWTCYECGGTGKVFDSWVERTPEYEAKLAERRAARARKKAQELRERAEEINNSFLERNGFNKDGKTWVVLGDTYQVKDQLKEIGCKWSNIIGWHIDHDLDGYDTLEVDVEDCFYKGHDEVYKWQNWKLDVADKIKEANKSLKPKGEHVGQIGDKIRISATLTGFHYFSTQYGDTQVYTFKDIFGNTFVWKTKGCLERIIGNVCHHVDVGEKVELIGTVKDHDEYNGVKQTVLIRVKIVNE